MAVPSCSFITRPIQVLALLLAVVHLAPAVAGATTLSRVDGTPFTGIDGELGWADIDADGDLDAFLGRAGRLFRNDDGVFVLQSDFGSRISASIDWGDFDGDGDVDLARYGRASFQDPGQCPIVYENTGGSFAPLPNVVTDECRSDGVVRWHDWDADGDLDLVVFAHDDATVKLYRNSGGTLSPEATTIPAPGNGWIGFFDVDADRDLDIHICGRGIDGEGIHQFYLGAGGTYFPGTQHLLSLTSTDASYGDFDDDGDVDMIVSGWHDSHSRTLLFENQSADMVDTAHSFVDVTIGASELGDLDNDGDLDLLLGGWNDNLIRVTRTYRNDSSGWSQWDLGIPNMEYVDVDFGDYDADGDLDVLISGLDLQSHKRAELYRNENSGTNLPPTVPQNLHAAQIGTAVEFSWSASNDAETASPGLTYNLRVGTTPGGNEILASHADPLTGSRLLAKQGNAGHTLGWKLELAEFASQTVYWSVQAIDHGYAGSAFAPEQAISVPVGAPAAPDRIVLGNAIPNPFNPSTTLRFELSRRQKVSLEVFDSAGRRVRSLWRGALDAGSHTVRWNGRDNDGRDVASGVYFCRLRAGTVQETRRMVLAK